MFLSIIRECTTSFRPAPALSSAIFYDLEAAPDPAGRIARGFRFAVCGDGCGSIRVNDITDPHRPKKSYHRLG
jgi:hypothetical protein